MVNPPLNPFDADGLKPDRREQLWKQAAGFKIYRK
jgi:hypothetical protein